MYLMSTLCPMYISRIRFIFGINTKNDGSMGHAQFLGKSSKVRSHGVLEVIVSVPWLYEYLQEVATDINSLDSVAPVIIIQYIYIISFFMRCWA